MAVGDSYITFYGLWHLIVEEVTVTILGLDCGEYTVANDGSIQVPYAADAGGLLTPDYLILNTNVLTGVENNVTFSVYNGATTVPVTVPVVIGVNYTTQGQVLRPDLAADLRSPLGPGLGKTRRGHMLAAFVQDAIAIKWGTDFSETAPLGTLTPATFRDANGVTERDEDDPFSGVYWGTLKDNYGFDSMLAWQVDGPYPCTICSVSIFLDFEER